MTPPGAVLPWAGINSLPPTGWLFCDGSDLSIFDYFDLANIIGTTYGIGSSPGTVRLPNLENRIPVGKGTDTGGYNLDTIGATGGSETVSLTKQQLPKHNHVIGTGTDGSSISDPGDHNHGIYQGGGPPFTQNWDVFAGGDSQNSVQSTLTDGGSHTHTGNTGDGTTDGLNGDAHGNMPPYIIMRYIIKY